jgi:hypothetical protein
MRQGVRLGWKPKLAPHQQRETIKCRDVSDLACEIARSYNANHSTISRWTI